MTPATHTDTVPEALLPEPSEAVQRFLRQPHRLLIGGEWRDGGSDRIIAVENPARGQTVAELAAASSGDVDAAVLAARRAFEGPWGRMAPKERARILHRFADLLTRDAQMLAEIETLENGVPIVISRDNPRGFCPDLLRYYAGWTTKISGDTLPTASDNQFIATIKEPLGVIGAIIPWNAPAPMLALKMAPALAAGCTMVLKPSELTPLVAERFAALLLEAGAPPGTFNLVQGFGEDVGAAIASHPGVDKVCFTGSTRVGKQIVAAAVGNLKRVSLELGGKSPVIVFPDADLAAAIPSVAMSCFFVSGQACMAGTRLFVHEAIHDAFVDGLVAFARNLTIGDGLLATTMIGPVISERQKSRILGYIESGCREGAHLQEGGSALPRVGHFIPPTIFTQVDAAMKISQEEIFGPVLAVHRFADGREDDVIRIANSTVYGLSAAVWTSSLDRAFRVARSINSGQVAVNAPTQAVIAPEVPFGGNKQSGWGREFGREGLEEYLKTKAISFSIAGRANAQELQGASRGVTDIAYR